MAPIHIVSWWLLLAAILGYAHIILTKITWGMQYRLKAAASPAPTHPATWFLACIDDWQQELLDKKKRVFKTSAHEKKVMSCLFIKNSYLFGRDLTKRSPKYLAGVVESFYC